MEGECVCRGAITSYPFSCLLTILLILKSYGVEGAFEFFLSFDHFIDFEKLWGGGCIWIITTMNFECDYDNVPGPGPELGN